MDASDQIGATTVPQAAWMFTQLEDAVLIKLVLQAVNEFDIALPSAGRWRGARINPAQTTTLLAYCYARGIYASEEIEARAYYNPAIAYINAGSRPDWHLLRRFRRQNGLLILGVLTRLMELVAFHLGSVRTAEVPAKWQAGFRAQAVDHLRESIQIDSMVMDH